MNLLKNSLVSKLMLVALMLVGAKAMSAESKLYIEPVVVDDYKVRSIPVVLEHDGTMGALNFDIELSKSLEFVSSDFDKAITRNPDFVVIANGQQMTGTVKVDAGYQDSQTARVMVVSRRNMPFPTEKGIVAYVNVKAKANSLDKTIEANPELAITVKRVTVTTPDNSAHETLADKTYDLSQISEIKLAVTDGDVTMKPGETAKVMLNLVNNVDVAAFTFDVELPEGFSIDVNDCGFTSRASNGAWLDAFPNKTNPNMTRFIVTDIATNHAFTGKSGDIMWLGIKAPESFDDKVTVKVTKVEVGTKESKTFYGPDFNFNIINAGPIEENRVAANAAALQADKDAIAALQAALEAAKTAAAEKYAAFDATAAVAAINTAIAALDKKADDEAARVEKEGNYVPQVTEEAVAPVNAEIAALVTKANEARVAANKAAYDADIAKITPFETQLAMAIAQVAGNENYDVTADKEAAEKAIADAKEAAAANLAKVAEEGVYASTLDTTPIATAIAAIAKNADAATAEAARVAANKAANEAELAAIAAVETKLNETLASVAETYPDYDAAAEKAAIEKTIADAKEAAAANLAKVEKEGTYAATFEAAPVEEAIAAIVANAKAAADKAAAEALKAANDEAKAKADAEVAALNDALKAAVAEIAESCPLVAELYNGEAEAAAIASLESAINAAYESLTLAADYDNVIAPAADVKAAIASLVEEAKAAQAAEEAEIARVEANKKAYEAELAAIQQLLDELQAEVDKFDKEWTNLQFETRLGVENYINSLGTKVENENNRVASEGTYNNQIKDSDLAMARGLIAEYVQKVQTSGIDSIVADENGAVRIYTIDGVRHDRLVPGVNIIVKEDGTTTKVYVK
ncbi:MAG: hypothetical protein NC212_07550 [Staphylococcus sp.]|nr:hypothetical protein [Staphylococcus sp.]